MGTDGGEMKERLLTLIYQIEGSSPQNSKGRLKWCSGIRDDQIVVTGNQQAIFRLGCELVKASALHDQRIEELKHFFDDSSKIKDVVIFVMNETTFQREVFQSKPKARERIWKAMIRVFGNGRE
jgi:hypothetical protein